MDFDSSLLLQQIINGLVLGSMYALIALGYTMVYGIINLINFAHGEVLMVGALTSWSVVGALQNWQPNYKPYPFLLPGAVDVAGATITYTQILALALTAVSLAVLSFIVSRTRLGRAMRATAENPRVAALMGVKPDWVISATFIIGAVLAAVAGVMWAANYGSVNHTTGFLPGLKAFTAAVFGGIGNLPGAVLGGILLGLVESIGAGYLGDWTGGFLGSHYVDILSFGILIVILVFKPSGLLGERVADRA